MCCSSCLIDQGGKLTNLDINPPDSSTHEILQARILEWVAMLSSRGSSQPREWTWVSCIAGRFFLIWATGETNPWKVKPLTSFSVCEIETHRFSLSQKARPLLSKMVIQHLNTWIEIIFIAGSAMVGANFREKEELVTLWCVCSWAIERFAVCFYDNFLWGSINTFWNVEVPPSESYESFSSSLMSLTQLLWLLWHAIISPTFKKWFSDLQPINLVWS